MFGRLKQSIDKVVNLAFCTGLLVGSPTVEASEGWGAVLPAVVLPKEENPYLSLWAGAGSTVYNNEERGKNIKFYFTSNLNAVPKEDVDTKGVRNVSFDIEEFSVRPRLKAELISLLEGDVKLGSITKYEIRSNKEDNVRSGIYCESSALKNNRSIFKFYLVDSENPEMQATFYSVQQLFDGKIAPSLYILSTKSRDSDEGYFYGEISLEVKIGDNSSTVSLYGQEQYYADFSGNTYQRPLFGLKKRF